MAFFRKGGKRASELLDLCKETYAVRSAEYGDSYIVIGNALSAIFPEGVRRQACSVFSELVERGPW
jgi:hypothetical protein